MGRYEARHEEVGRRGFAMFLLAVNGIEIIRSNRVLSGVSSYPVGAPIFMVGLDSLALSACGALRLPRRVRGFCHSRR